MEIAALVVGIIALLALTSGGTVGGKLTVTPNAPLPGGPFGGGVSYPPVDTGGPGMFPSPVGTIGPILAPQPVYVGPVAQPVAQPYTPSPAPSFNPPMVPAQKANVGGALLGGSAAIGTALLPHLGVAAAAVPIVGAAIVVAAAVAASLLAAHEARLKGATNENQAVDQWVPVFDSFVSSVVNAYNGGQINAQQAAQICMQFDQTLYNKFRSFVGQPGTAWNDQTGMSGQCNKACTVGCCVYYQDLSVVLNDISYVLGYPTGKWGKGDPRISGRTITVPKVYPSKYSSYTRALYTVTLK